MKTNAQLQSDRRARLSCGGIFKRRDFYCHPDDEAELRKLETTLKESRLCKAENARISAETEITFNFGHGIIPRTTATVLGLRMALLALPDNMPVFAEWNDYIAFVDMRMFGVQQVEKCGKSFKSLVIDVNDV